LHLCSGNLWVRIVETELKDAPGIRLTQADTRNVMSTKQKHKSSESFAGLAIHPKLRTEAVPDSQRAGMLTNAGAVISSLRQVLLKRGVTFINAEVTGLERASPTSNTVTGVKLRALSGSPSAPELLKADKFVFAMGPHLSKAVPWFARDSVKDLLGTSYYRVTTVKYAVAAPESKRPVQPVALFGSKCDVYTRPPIDNKVEVVVISHPSIIHDPTDGEQPGPEFDPKPAAEDIKELLDVAHSLLPDLAKLQPVSVEQCYYSANFLDTCWPESHEGTTYAHRQLPTLAFVPDSNNAIVVRPQFLWGFTESPGLGLLVTRMLLKQTLPVNIDLWNPLKPKPFIAQALKETK
jgi:glycine/D-amino acid oxidase-like deaminating enzyme